jgi:predicted glycosyltransferase
MEEKQRIIIIKRGEENKEQKSQAQQIQKLSLDQFLKDKKIVIQTRGALITGIFHSIVNEFLVLKNAKIIGTKHIATADLFFVNRNSILHIHTEPKNLSQKVKTPQTKN